MLVLIMDQHQLVIVLSDDRSYKEFQGFVETLTYWCCVTKIRESSIDGSDDLYIVMFDIF